MSTLKEHFTDPQKTGIWFSNLLKESGYLEHEMAQILDVSESRILNWATGRSGMRRSYILAILIITNPTDKYKDIRKKTDDIFMELRRIAE